MFAADHASSVYGSESINAFSPNFRLDVDHLLQDVMECDHDDEMSQVCELVTGEFLTANIACQ